MSDTATARPTTCGTPGHARSVLDARQRLHASLGDAAGQDDGLTILLFLFAQGHAAPLSTAACCAAVRAPRTTALRWIRTLIDAGLLEQHAHAADRRVTMLDLTDRARDAVRRWLIDLAAA